MPDKLANVVRGALEGIKTAREASGCEAHYREAEALQERAGAIFARLSETKPVTLAGAIAMLEQEGARELIALVLEGLRDLQGKLR